MLRCATCTIIFVWKERNPHLLLCKAGEWYTYPKILLVTLLSLSYKLASGCLT